MIDLKKFDAWLDDAGPAALVIREHLVPVEGADGVLFPATFATGDGFPGGYNVDHFADGKSVCLIDSVGSQANRIEPLFSKAGYSELVPQIVVKAGEKLVNLLEAGHRAGDAIVRCSELQEELRAGFVSVQSGNAEPLAKIAPTSLVFGAWDSRDTGAKLPRLMASTIRAFDVRELKRSAQYVPAAEYVKSGLLDEAADKKARDAYAEQGLYSRPCFGRSRRCDRNRWNPPRCVASSCCPSLASRRRERSKDSRPSALRARLGTYGVYILAGRVPAPRL